MKINQMDDQGFEIIADFENKRLRFQCLEFYAYLPMNNINEDTLQTVVYKRNQFFKKKFDKEILENNQHLQFEYKPANNSEYKFKEPYDIHKSNKFRSHQDS